MVTSPKTLINKIKLLFILTIYINNLKYSYAPLYYSTNCTSKTTHIFEFRFLSILQIKEKMNAFIILDFQYFHSVIPWYSKSDKFITTFIKEYYNIIILLFQCITIIGTLKF
jgi:hypothetical protein